MQCAKNLVVVVVGVNLQARSQKSLENLQLHQLLIHDASTTTKLVVGAQDSVYYSTTLPEFESAFIGTSSTYTTNTTTTTLVFAFGGTNCWWLKFIVGSK